LTGTSYSAQAKKCAPLHIKPEAVASLNPSACLALPQSQASLASLEEALRWIFPSPVYQAIEDECKTFHMRDHRISFNQAELQMLFDARKLSHSETPPVAWCNAFAVYEEKEEGLRRRPIFEPLVNDIIAKSVNPLLSVRTTYTPREEIRRAVFLSECGAQFDYSAWFDQIPLHPDLRKFFGVSTTTGTFVLPLLAMGFKPSCQVAQALTNSIRDVNIANVFSGSCVDNVLFTGSRADVTAASSSFIQRSDSVGARLKSKTIELRTAYDFLGEHYDHVAKTRCLSQKTADKAYYALNFLRQRKPSTTKQLRAIYGLLLYAAGTLRIVVARFHWAMRFMSWFASTPEDRLHVIPSDVRTELVCWAQVASENTPVAVWEEEAEVDLTIYTDASATGWGAISVSKGGSVLCLSQPWTAHDHAAWNLSSSVAAEPLAIRKAVAALVPRTARRVLLYTDHESFCFAAEKSWGKAYAYSCALQFLSSYGTKFDIRHIAGELNPADVLSRARHMPDSFTGPPLLPVTAIGDRVFNSREEGERGQMG